MSREIEHIKKYVRAANYLSAIQIYLQDNFLLKRRLNPNDIKPRLLGHWGTCPGINFAYANLNNLIRKKKCEILFVLGTGHGFPALQANLFMEGTLKEFYPEAKTSESGIKYVARSFSWPYGFPSHTNPGTPGAILEGGELGYALSTAYGAALDNRELIVACMIGDGEAETGPTAAAWHLNKFLNPQTDGTVLPILHLNGYKISGPTIFGKMGNHELAALFEGYGYEPMIVEGGDEKIYNDMAFVLEKAYEKIIRIKSDSHTHREKENQKFPMIILKTKKGWTGIKELHGEKIEGNYLSHQVVARDAKTNPEELKALEKWMKSYKFYELFDGEEFAKEVTGLIPRENLRMGKNKHAYGWKIHKPLHLPNLEKFAEAVSTPGSASSSSMRRVGEYLNEVFRMNRKNKNFRLMSPDETYSNKLDAVFKTTKREFNRQTEKWEKDIGKNGRVIEILSEHALQGLAQGYIMTGRHSVFASYEAFIEIVSSMVDQYAKFLKVGKETKWRKDAASMNFILTSSGWRQEHNGFSHQNPSFISGMLEKNNCDARIYFPPDGNSALAVLKKCLESKGRINVIVAGKTLEPRWISVKQAEQELKNGLSIWNFASDKNPDIIFAGIGDYMTKETLAAIDYLKRNTKIKARFVNVIELTPFGFGNETCKSKTGSFSSFPSGKSKVNFEKYFTKGKPVIFNYHGYPTDIYSFLFEQENHKRFKVHGYIENGSTTTPFDMHVRNKTSRYHLVIEALEILSRKRAINEKTAKELIEDCKKKIEQHRKYIIKNGKDPEEIENWRWKK